MGEIAIEQSVVLKARQRGILGLKLTSPGNTGVPDRMFLIPGGRPLYIEFKKPGEELNPKQVYWYNIFKLLNYHIEVHDSVEQALKAIGRAVNEANKTDKR